MNPTLSGQAICPICYDTFLAYLSLDINGYTAASQESFHWDPLCSLCQYFLFSCELEPQLEGQSFLDLNDFRTSESQSQIQMIPIPEPLNLTVPSPIIHQVPGTTLDINSVGTSALCLMLPDSTAEIQSLLPAATMIKRKRSFIPLEMKKLIIDYHEKISINIQEISRRFDIKRTTIYGIIKRKGRVASAKGVKRSRQSRNRIGNTQH